MKNELVETVNTNTDIVRKFGGNMNYKSISIGLGIGLIIMGLTLFWTGFHNADLIQNYVRIYAYFDLDYSMCSECNSYGCSDCDKVYSQGLDRLITGTFVMMFGGLVLGSGLSYREGDKKWLK